MLEARKIINFKFQVLLIENKKQQAFQNEMFN